MVDGLGVGGGYVGKISSGGDIGGGGVGYTCGGVSSPMI